MVGIGGALIQALLSAAAEQGWSALSLSVDRENPARRLYERYGFCDASVSQPSDSSVTLVRYFACSGVPRCCKSQDSVGEISTAIWVGTWFERKSFWPENDPQNYTIFSR
ncbi:GNAT family N-acetyltransferase [Ktedonobacter sp. SOSP1-52]|uniref:GNAT family N-acetyltransferase n=1 Tax=Ktedonobacter sp. SOSP1-52 TaxID=2778366 RepID=UPI0035B4657B